MKTKPIPDGYSSITPYLIVHGAAAAIDFYQQVFGATERLRLAAPGGRVGHAELVIGGSVIMLADDCGESKARGPKELGGSPVMIHVYTEDVDTVFGRAVAAGATVSQAVENKFYGDRSGGFVDPFGHHWFVATHVEDVSEEEMSRRAAAAMKG